ncbi:PH domain-containing protein [Streptomyces sp. NPDC005548]|uniref:PH domain-containing protein n=1 Tax=Streptomyces sp. NPDC005548 TaxID=3364724 RepID=UPI003675B5C3
MTDDPHVTYRSEAGGVQSLLRLGGAGFVVHADADGVRYRTPLRRRTIRWPDVAAVRVHRTVVRSRTQGYRRVSLLLGDGRVRYLPEPRSYETTDPVFDAQVEVLRTLHRRHEAPEDAEHLHVITTRTGGHSLVGPLAWCVPLLIVAMTIALWAVPRSLADERAWRAAVPCAAATPVADRGECLATRPGTVVRTDVHEHSKYNSIYLSAGRKTERVGVSHEMAGVFVAGDRLEVTFWRGRPRAFVGAHGVWHEHRAPAGQLLALAVAFALAAGYPAAQAVRRIRGRRLPDDEVLPSALPFAAVLLVSALWLLPLCVLHPTDPFGSPATITWAGAGAAVTVGLFVLAFRASRVRPASVAAPMDEAGDADGETVFLRARFLEHTEYNPYEFGTHVVLGGGDVLAVSSHSGPGRFGARRVPVERLTLRRVRRVRGGDGDGVRRDWHVAEFDDAGTPVRLAAAPDDLARVVGVLEHAGVTRADSEVPTP